MASARSEVERGPAVLGLRIDLRELLAGENGLASLGMATIPRSEVECGPAVIGLRIDLRELLARSPTSHSAASVIGRAFATSNAVRP